MRAAATVVRLMPSPTNRITFLALPDMAPRCAACAAPSWNHQPGVSSFGCAMTGTSTATAEAADGAWTPWLAQALASTVMASPVMAWERQACGSRDIGPGYRQAKPRLCREL